MLISRGGITGIMSFHQTGGPITGRALTKSETTNVKNSGKL